MNSRITFPTILNINHNIKMKSTSLTLKPNPGNWLKEKSLNVLISMHVKMKSMPGFITSMNKIMLNATLTTIAQHGIALNTLMRNIENTLKDNET